MRLGPAIGTALWRAGICDPTTAREFVKQFERVERRELEREASRRTFEFQRAWRSVVDAMLAAFDRR